MSDEELLNRVRDLAREHANCSGCQTPWWLKDALGMERDPEPQPRPTEAERIATEQRVSTLTTDPTDPALGHGSNDTPVPQNEKYLVLSEEERAKGFVRPLRRSYIHVGIDGHEVDPENPAKHGRTGDACGAQTGMGLALCETYAADPKFYGSTYCVGCQMHRPVAEFVWAEDGERVGS